MIPLFKCARCLQIYESVPQLAKLAAYICEQSFITPPKFEIGETVEFDIRYEKSVTDVIEERYLGRGDAWLFKIYVDSGRLAEGLQACESLHEWHYKLRNSHLISKEDYSDDFGESNLRKFVLVSKGTTGHGPR